MGKRNKQGASLRAKKRADAAAAELSEAVAERSERTRAASKPDGTLFVLDTGRDEKAVARNVARKDRTADLTKEEKVAKREAKYGASVKDERQVKDLVRRHNEGELTAIAAAGKKRLGRGKKRVGGNLGGVGKAGTAKVAKFDLWGGATDAGGKKKVKASVMVPSFTGVASAGGTAPMTFVEKRPATNADDGPVASSKWLRARAVAAARARPTLAVDVARDGQSYRPDAERHQDAIGEALSIEVRRNEAVAEKKRPVGGGGLSEETLAVMVGDDESDDSESDGEDEGEGTRVAVKRDGKLTRAQRNKRKRAKNLDGELSERKRVKRLERQINHVPVLSKEIKKSEAACARRGEEVRKLKAEAIATPLGKDIWSALTEEDPIHTPSLPVALTEELDASKGRGTLRTIKPKGSLLTDRLESMAARKMIFKKKVEVRNVVQGKKRKMKGGKGREYMLI